MGVNRLQVELVLQITVLVLQLRKIAVSKCFVAVTDRNGLKIKQSGLSEEDGFNLKKVVAVVGNGLQRNAQRPLLKSFSIDSETIVACLRDETSRLPRAITGRYASQDGFRFLLQSLGLQGCEP